MIILGVETSGATGSIALQHGGRCLEERFLPELGRRHAQSLVPEVVALLARHDLSPMQLDAVAVSVGPGSFTGLRIGVTFAKTLAYAAGADLAAVETFEAIAANTPAAPSVAVVADAQRKGLVLGRYDRAVSGRFVRREPPRLIAVDQLPAEMKGIALLNGPAIDRIESPGELPLEIAAVPLRFPRASAVARLGEGQLDRGESAEPWTLEPLYVRKSAAEEKVEVRR